MFREGKEADVGFRILVLGNFPFSLFPCSCSAGTGRGFGFGFGLKSRLPKDSLSLFSNRITSAAAAVYTALTSHQIQILTLKSEFRIQCKVYSGLQNPKLLRWFRFKFQPCNKLESQIYIYGIAYFEKLCTLGQPI